MPLRYQLKDTDTVEYLALTYLGDATRWRDIVDYNNLVYPYISPDKSDKMKVYASGYIHVTRATADFAITIRSGWTLKTRKSIMSSIQKSYTVINDVTMDIGVTEAYVFVRSIVPGIQGNTPQNTITELGDEFYTNAVVVTVNNDNPITNGVEGVVKITGEYVFIPSDADTTSLQQYGTTFDYNAMNYFYGTDLTIDSDDLVVNQDAGDLATVSYTDNLVQAINRRLTTEKGDILFDFDFGNGIIDIIGDSHLPPDAQKSLIAIEIKQCLQDEDRIKDLVINSITIVPSELTCYVDITMTIVNLGTTINLSGIQLGGIANV